MNDWLQEIKTAKLPKLARGKHHSPAEQELRMPRKAVIEPNGDMDYWSPNDEPPMTVNLNIKHVPVGEVQLCAMEMVAFMEGEHHTDQPQCVCPTLAHIMITLNDNLHDWQRNVLLPYLPLCVGTRGDGNRQRRRVLAERYFQSALFSHGRLKEFLDKLFEPGKSKNGAPTGFTKPERVELLKELVHD